MPANVSNYIGRASAWHGLGTVKGEHLTRQDIDDAGVTFNAVKHQLEYAGKKIEAWGIFHGGNGQFIAPCSESYAIHQPSVIFDTTDAIIAAANHGSKYETAGNLLDWRKAWGLVDLKASIRVGDDHTDQYLLGVTSFDGSVATDFMQTGIRVVCNNTLTMALSDKTKKRLRIKHTSQSIPKLEDARDALLSVKDDFKNTEEVLNFMANRMLNVQAVTNILDMVITLPVGKPDRIRENKRRENILDEIIGLYELNDNNAFPEQRGTAYNLLNAITNYTDHLRSTRTSDGENVDTNRAISAVAGSGQALKTKAFSVIMDASKNLPMRAGQRSTMVQVLELPAIPSTPLLDAILADA